jgi:N-terminal domain of anti-restriction factor ArdC
MAQTQTQTQTPTAVWQGSQATYSAVYSQIAERWGNEEADKYDPRKNCFTFQTWKQKGYHIKKGEKALRSYTYVKQQEIVTSDAGNAQLVTTARYPKNVCLFFYLQVEKN